MLAKSSSGKGTACIRCTKLKKSAGWQAESRGRKRQRVQVVSEAESEVGTRSRSVGRRVKGKKKGRSRVQVGGRGGDREGG